MTTAKNLLHHHSVSLISHSNLKHFSFLMLTFPLRDLIGQMLILHSSTTQNEQTKVRYDRNYFRNGMLLIQDESQWNERRHDVDKKGIRRRIEWKEQKNGKSFLLCFCGIWGISGRVQPMGYLTSFCLNEFHWESSAYSIGCRGSGSEWIGWKFSKKNHGKIWKVKKIKIILKKIFLEISQIYLQKILKLFSKKI